MSTIAKFTLVQIVASDSGRPRVEVWQPAGWEQPSLITTPKLLGVTATASNQFEQVAVIKRGYLRDVNAQNAESWAVGDLLWGMADGSITKVRPDAPFPQVFVGSVYDGAGDPHMINVDVQVLPSLGELSGVSREDPEDLDVFIFKASTHVWEPRVLDYGARSTFLHPFLFLGGC